VTKTFGTRRPRDNASSRTCETYCDNGGLTDTLGSCYSHALIIITDSEEKRHGGTSQEVSQEVRR
jgi:hypothetical protein